jgi:hypothetical protein
MYSKIYVKRCTQKLKEIIKKKPSVYFSFSGYERNKKKLYGPIKISWLVFMEIFNVILEN